MKLKDLRKQCAEEDKTFTIYVKPKKFSYNELVEELESIIEENDEFTEEELKGYIFRNYIYDIIDEPNDLIIKL